MSNVMLAFLGTNDYLPCNYSLDGMDVSNVRFVQEALASILCKDWSEEDKIIVFLTKEAKNKNWADNGHKDRDGKPLQRVGLEHRLEQLNLKVSVGTRDIPDGRSEYEIWDMFDLVFNQIQDGDEIIFDITHAFRSLPMLVIIILNYARALKDIKIKGIYYGAFESLGTIRDVEKMHIEDRKAPIFNLTPFVHLFNWTVAIDDFLTYGDAKNINVLTNEGLTPILRATEGKDKSAQNLKNLSTKLKKMTELIQTSRGLSVIRDFDFNNLRELISYNKESILKPINPLLDKISDKIKDFNNNDIENGYAAVEWCIEHNLIQQAYTILQETMITEIVAKHFGESEIANRDKRELVSQAINIKHRRIPEDKWNKAAENNKDVVLKIMSELDDNFIRIFDSVSQYRNDIDHAGFRDSPHKPEGLKRKLKEYYEKLKEGANHV
jgi:CRISPR-associated Csx2 family protein